MKLEILEEAETELNEAVAYYQEIESGLGIRLKKEVRGAIQWISHNPELPRLRPKGYRRVNLKVFAYYVAYDIWADTIWILAIAHGRRRPEYWIERKKSIG
jgi:plasmid stabilization system protein ParE